MNKNKNISISSVAVCSSSRLFFFMDFTDSSEVNSFFCMYSLDCMLLEDKNIFMDVSLCLTHIMIDFSHNDCKHS